MWRGAGRRVAHSAATEGGAGSEAHRWGTPSLEHAGAPPRQAGLPDSAAAHAPGSPNDSPESTAAVTASLEVRPTTFAMQYVHRHWRFASVTARASVLHTFELRPATTPLLVAATVYPAVIYTTPCGPLKTLLKILTRIYNDNAPNSESSMHHCRRACSLLLRRRS